MRRWCQVSFFCRTAQAAILVFFCLSCSHHAPGEVPHIVKGGLDLSTWRFETHGPVRLDGEWEFFWGRLAEPSDLLAGRVPAPSFRPVPGLWNRPYKSAPGFPINGYATYSLRLTGLTPGTPLALSIPEMHTAYRMWLDTMEVASNGIVATDRAHSFPQYLPQTITVFPQRHEARLIVQVANFHGPSGGIPRSIIAGTQHQMILRAFGRRAFNVFMIGALLVIALYYTGLYTMGKKEPTLLILGALGALLIVKSLVVVGDRLIVQFFPAFPWGLLQKIDFIPLYLGVAFYSSLFYVLYPKETGRWPYLLIFGTSLVMTGSLLALPTQAVFAIHSPGQYLCLASALYGAYVLVLAIIRKREGAVAIALGFLFQLITIILDTLFEKNVIEIVYVGHVGNIIFSLFVGSVINSRFIRDEQRARERRDELAHIEKLATMGTVVAGVAHEINNPNNSLYLDAQTQQKALTGLFNVLDEQDAALGEVRIGGYGYQDLKHDLLSASQRMIRNSQRITRIVSNLRALGKKDVPMDENIDLNATVLSALGVVDHVVKRSTRALRLELAPGIPFVKGNSQHIEQVVINLVRNACQALPDMDRAVTIATGFDAAQRRVSLTVADEGSGMDEEARKNALTPFYTTKGGEGTGLGLSICKNIVTAHGGAISIDSAHGKGTAIRITLPVTPAHV
jgi:two-component system, sensor histidine kinase ChiS